MLQRKSLFDKWNQYKLLFTRKNLKQALILVSVSTVAFGCGLCIGLPVLGWWLWPVKYADPPQSQSPIQTPISSETQALLATLTPIKTRLPLITDTPIGTSTDAIGSPTVPPMTNTEPSTSTNTRLPEPTNTPMPQSTVTEPPTAVPPIDTPLPTATTALATLTLVSLTSPISAGSDARVVVQTEPDASCFLGYTTPSGTKSGADGLGATVADGNGICSWTWNIGPRTNPGTGKLTITANGVTQFFDIVIQ